MSGKPTQNNISHQSTSTSDKDGSKDEKRSRERFSSRRSRSSTDSKNHSRSHEKHKITSAASRAESQAELLPEKENDHTSSEITSKTVFEDFDINNPCKFLENAVRRFKQDEVYAGLQHGMVCDPELKLNKTKLSKLLKKPIEQSSSDDFKQIILYLKAFTIMHACDDVTLLPTSTENINTQALKSKFKLRIHINDSEKQPIVDIIQDQFNTEIGRVFLLAFRVHKMCGDDTVITHTIHEWYTQYKNDGNVATILRDTNFLEIIYSTEGDSPSRDAVSHRELLTEITPASSSISY